MPPVITRDPEAPTTAYPASPYGGDRPSARASDTTVRSFASRTQRGPFRPEQLVPARARLEARALAHAFRGVDALVSVIVCMAAYGLRFQGLSVAGEALAAGLALAVGLLALLLALPTLQAYVFAHREPLPRHMLRVLAAFGAAATASLIVTLMTTPTADRDLFPVWVFMGLAPLLSILHLAWWSIISRGRSQGRLTPNVVVVGATDNAEHLIEAALRTGEINVLGIFDDRLDRAPDNIRGVPVLGDTSAMIDHHLMPYVDRVVIAVSSSAQGRVRQLVEKLDVLPNPISLFVDVGRATDGEVAVARIADAALAELSGTKINARRAFTKRAQDVLVGALGLVVAAPVMAIVAVAVKLDSPGPIFFRQRRHGFNNEEILVWKFRSMRHEMADARAARQISANDDRVTRVGKFIRATSLDELPQLFNVMRGEMSIVGPRPHAVGMKTGDIESAKLVAQYAHRHRMKPGVTGWAAINGSRGPVDTPELVRERVALDVDYIERQSFWLDFYIIVMTIPCLLGDRSTVR